MPKTTSQRIVFTLIGVFLMANTMAAFNKYLVYGEFSAEYWQQVLIAFCQKAPLAFVIQFFFLQKFAAKQAAKYPTDNRILYSLIRTGFTVLLMCPMMSLYSNLILAVQFHWTLGRLLSNWVPKMAVNWIFAYMVQIFLLGPLTRTLYGLTQRIFSRA